MDTDRQALEFAEQLRLLHRHSFAVYAGNLAATSLMVFVLRDFIALTLLLSWAAAVWLLVFIRLSVSHIIAKPKTGFANHSAWRLFFILGSGLSGLLWGIAGVLFFLPDNPATIAFVVIMLAGMTAGSLASHSAYIPTYIAFAVPTLTPVGVRLLLEGGNINIAVSIAVFFYLGVNLTYSRNIQRAILDAIRLRFDNLDLINDLESQKAAAETARIQAEHANLAKSQFLAAASHDLRQPVHALGLLVDAIDNVQTEQERDDLLAKIRRSLAVLGDLFNALLDISKLDAGVIDCDVHDISLDEIGKRLDAEFRPRVEQKNLSLEWKDLRHVVRSDPILMERILRNLVHNAVHFTVDGKVTVVAHETENNIRIDVRDTGPGIDAEDQDRIFVEFAQLGNPERDRRKGLGLGLAIVKRLCDLLDHEISVSSQVGEGTVFTLVLTKGVSAVKQVNAIESPAPAWSVSGREILVIDDEEGVLAATRALLEGWGCGTQIAESATDAINILNQSSTLPEMILADYRLRGNETGVDAIRAVHAHLGNPIPALLMTGDTAKERIEEAVKSGFHLLHKPVQPAQLRMAMNRLLTEADASPLQAE